MFGTKGVEEKGSSKWIRPGVQEVVIESVQGIDGEKSYLEFKFRLPESGPEDVNSQRLYIHTEKSFRLNMSRLKYIAKHVVSQEEIDALESDSIIEYGEKLDSMLSGKKLRMKFGLEEYIRNGEVKERAVLPLNNFCEAVMPGGDYPPVDAKDTKLTFDESDIKRVSLAEKAALSDSSESNEDDLPF